MTTETEREAFEKVAKEKDWTLAVTGWRGEYSVKATQQAWEAWQARAALDQRQECVVTDEMVKKLADEYFRLCKLAEQKPMAGGFWFGELRGALQSIAQPVKVPDEIPRDPGAPDLLDGYRKGWNACREAMLAAAPEYRL